MANLTSKVIPVLGFGRVYIDNFHDNILWSATIFLDPVQAFDFGEERLQLGQIVRI